MTTLVLGTAALMMMFYMTAQDSQGSWSNRFEGISAGQKQATLDEDELMGNNPQVDEETDPIETVADRRHVREEVMRYM
ncbi:hypothetical protein ACFL3F_02640 [Planctomycetota bacterium]